MGNGPPTPSDFDVVKELNAHTGRLATALGIAFASGSLSLGNGPIHDALATTRTEYWPVYVALIFYALDLAASGFFLLNAMEPPLPQNASWKDCINTKQSSGAVAAYLLLAAFLAIGLAWVLAYVGPLSDWKYLSLALFIPELFVIGYGLGILIGKLNP